MATHEAERGPGWRGRNRAWWWAHVEAQVSEGAPASSYCRAHGLDAQRFYRWRRLLLGPGEAPSQDAGHDREVAPRSGPVFAEVRVADAAAGSPGVEVCLAGGRVVRVARGFDAATLRAVVSALEEGGC